MRKKQRVRNSFTGFILVAAMVGAPPAILSGCGGGFLGLQDYQRDLLYGIGSLALWLLGGQDSASPTPTPSASPTPSEPGAPGAPGEPGDQGPQGDPGPAGAPGAPGTSCTISDNGDGSFTISCGEGISATIRDGQDGADGGQGPAGPAGPGGGSGAPGAAGLSCWDLNGNGARDFCDPATQNSDGSCSECGSGYCVDVQEPQGNKIPEQCCCTNGFVGELDTCGFTEDTNGDGEINTLDCNCFVQENEDGTATITCGDGSEILINNRPPLFDSVFIDDFFTVYGGSYGSLSLPLPTPTQSPSPSPSGTPAELQSYFPSVKIKEPSLGECYCSGGWGDNNDNVVQEDFGGYCTDVIAYRMGMPQRYGEGDPVTMRMYFLQKGEWDGDCFVIRLDAFRARHLGGALPYGDYEGNNTRYIKFDLQDGPITVQHHSSGTLFVVDLPLNQGNPYDLSNGLGFTNDLLPADLLAFEVNTVDDDSLNDGRCYTLLGVDFFESLPGDASLEHAYVYSNIEDVVCHDCDTNGIEDDEQIYPDSPFDCNENSVIDACELCAPDVITFSEFQTGQIVDELYGTNGAGPVYVEGVNPLFPGLPNEAVIFDSANPSGDDTDLGTPNENFGGPGIGTGGESGNPYANSNGLGKVLIIDENMNVNTLGFIEVPDDNAGGGTFMFDFSSIAPATVKSITVVDIEDEGGFVEFFDSINFSVGTFPLPVTGDDGVATIQFYMYGVFGMTVTLPESGAIDNIEFTPAGCLIDANTNGYPDQCEG